MRLRYRAVRATSAAIAVIGLSIALTHHAHGPSTVPVQQADDDKFAVAVANFKNDSNGTFKRAVVTKLKALDPRLDVQVLEFNQTVGLEDMLGDSIPRYFIQSRARVLIWGTAPGPSGNPAAKLYERAYGNAQLVQSSLSDDFELPQVAPSDLWPILQLAVATQASRFFRAQRVVQVAPLVPLIETARTIADTNSDVHRAHSPWGSEARARVNLIVGYALSTQGEFEETDAPLQNAILYYFEALNEARNCPAPMGSRSERPRRGPPDYRPARA
jgi:hypothetical protein